MKNIKIILEEIQQIKIDDNLIDKLYIIKDKILACDKDEALETIEPLLKLIEKNPDIEFGNPGPIVHLVEKFYKYGYEEKLLESLNRKVVFLNLWMLNRIINGEQNNELKTKYLSILKKISKAEETENHLQKLAKEFLELHE